jgi:hypothetical protein
MLVFMVWRRLKGNFQSEAEFIDALNKKPELDYDSCSIRPAARDSAAACIP